MKKQYIKPETEVFSLYGGMVILADSGQGGGGGTDPDPGNTTPEMGGGGGDDENPWIEEGYAPGQIFIDD